MVTRGAKRGVTRGVFRIKLAALAAAWDEHAQQLIDAPEGWKRINEMGYAAALRVCARSLRDVMGKT